MSYTYEPYIPVTEGIFKAGTSESAEVEKPGINFKKYTCDDCNSCFICEPCDRDVKIHKVPGPGCACVEPRDVICGKETCETCRRCLHHVRCTPCSTKRYGEPVKRCDLCFGPHVCESCYTKKGGWRDINHTIYKHEGDDPEKCGVCIAKVEEIRIIDTKKIRNLKIEELRNK